MSDKKSKEALKIINQEEYEEYIEELRQKHIMDQKAIEAAGYDKGFKVGLELGIKQGLEIANNIPFAKKMLAKKIDINKVCYSIL